MFDDPGSGCPCYIVAKVLGAVLAVGSSVILFGEQTSLEANTDNGEHSETPTQTEKGQRSTSTGCCSKRCCAFPWDWLVTGPVLAGCILLCNLYFNNLGAAPVFVGSQPAPDGLAVFFCFAIGCVVPLLDDGNGDGDGDGAKSGKMVMPWWVPWLSLVLIIGALATCPGHHLAGPCIMALAVPGFWTLSWRLLVMTSAGGAAAAGSASSKKGCGYGISFAALLIVLHYLLYLSGEYFDLIPVLGTSVGGNEDLVLWLVVGPMVAGPTLTWMVQGCSLPSSKKDKDSKDKDSKGGTPPTLLPRLVVMGLVVAALVITAVAVAATAGSRGAGYGNGSGAGATTIKVMAYNNQASYDTDGRFNGVCMVQWLRAFGADYVSIPEGNSMKLNIGNRLGVEFYQSWLGYEAVEYGAPGYDNSIGPATLSSLPLLSTEQVALPKPGTGIERFMSVHTVRVGGLSQHLVVIASVHLEWFGDPSVQTRYW
jgi:hypothetical protein